MPESLDSTNKESKWGWVKGDVVIRRMDPEELDELRKEAGLEPVNKRKSLPPPPPID